MNDWKRISNFVKFSTKGITPKYVEKSSVIVVNQKCIRNNRIDYSFSQFTDDKKQIAESKFVKLGDILVNSTGAGTAGRCAFVSEIPKNHRLITDSHILILRCESYYEAQCLNYLLFSFEKQLMQFMTGSSGQSELDKVILLNLKTKMSTNNIEQQKIAAVLSALDAKIELNNQINSELEKIAKTIYDYWFVQFDFPDANGKPYKSSGGKMVWNEELKREIPEGWEVKNLFSSQYTKLVPTGVTYFEGEKIYLSTSEVENSQIINHSIKTNYLNRKSRANMQPKSKTIWFARMKDTKKIILIDDYCDDLIENYIFSTGFAGIELKNNSLYFLWNYINSKDFEDIKNRYSTGTTQKSITNEGIKKIKILISSQDLLNIFDSKASNVYKKIYVNNKQNQTLAELRDWLLPMLMNGQVKVE